MAFNWSNMQGLIMGSFVLLAACTTDAPPQNAAPTPATSNSSQPGPAPQSGDTAWYYVEKPSCPSMGQKFPALSAAGVSTPEAVAKYLADTDPKGQWVAEHRPIPELKIDAYWVTNKKGKEGNGLFFIQGWKECTAYARTFG